MLPYLVDRMPVVREPGLNGSLSIYTLAPDRIRFLTDEEVTRRKPEAKAARFRELYAMPGLRTAVHADGAPDITVGATNTKGVMPWNESGSRSTTSTPT